MYNIAYIHFGSMKFGVIQCPRCKRAKGIRTDSKTTKCPKCGRSIDVKKARILCSVDTEKELAFAVMEVNARLGDEEGDYEKEIKDIKKGKEKTKLNHDKEPYEIYDEIVRNLDRIKGRDEKIKAAAKELGRSLGEFTEKDFFEVLERIGFTEDEAIENYISKLIEDDVIFQPKNGKFRCLE
jgi:transcription elongation factor Elf1